MIPCAICGDPTKRPSAVPKAFKDMQTLRRHLIDSHSKYVAGALLSPKLNDKTHSWLFMNVVDYSTLTADTPNGNGNAVNEIALWCEN